ncbi:MAG TPA: xanthine dehydrogenase family protein molybdopterin-binding subunit [Hyphomicrobiales bacterium]|nr:xanthine dehydrogenase family protein molybdopterin-binding subunit [Hyphomicrobiales bacterium]
MAIMDVEAPAREPMIGRPIRRFEDATLVRGLGRYTDDVQVEGQAYAVIVRSAVAHGVIRGIDTEAAKAMPGVLAVYTAADLKAYGGLKSPVGLNNRDGSPIRKPAKRPLAEDKVRYVGDPIACVVAETREQARDAAEAVVPDIEPLPAVTDAAAATAAGAPQLYDDVPNNICLDYHYGDAEKVAEAFARAAHVTRLELVNNRLVINPMEPRSALAVYDAAEEHFTLHVCSQGVFGLRNGIADLLGVPQDRVRVLTGNVGGSFGMKTSPYPEYLPVLHAARELGRPVKWTDDRSGSFLSDHHGRGHQVRAELALDREGRFLAIRITGFGNMGAYLSSVAPLMPSFNIVKNVVSVYRTPLVEVSAKCVFTNSSPVGAYRGAGRPEANYYMERLVDAAARETGIDRIELRRRNHIRPDEMPFSAASGMVYDSGDFTAVLNETVAKADIAGFPARKAESAKRGKLRGLAVGSYLEVTAPPNKEMGGIRFEPDGAVTIITGTFDYGQGHAAPFAQVLSDRLGIPMEKVRLLQGDSDELIAGGGSGGSRSITASGAAIVKASDEVIERGRAIAGAILEASAADIEFADGRFTIAGTGRGIGILEMAQRLRDGAKMPEEVPPSLDVRTTTDPIPSAFPNGCHAVEVEIDPETGIVEVVRHASVNDFGVIVNPMLVEGQVHGGVVQGIGQALMERTVYDESGQLLTGSFTDYALPRADNIGARFSFTSHPVPAKTNPLGTKGCGEAGCAGALVSVMNAVLDAVRDLGVHHLDMPATPDVVWKAIQEARARG